MNVLPKAMLFTDDVIEEMNQNKADRLKKDEKFRRREDRRLQNEQLKSTDEQLNECFPALVTELKKRQRDEV